MTGELAEQIRKAAEVLKSHGAKEVYVFGSAAEGRLRADSDVDLAVEGLPAEVFFRALSEATDVLGRPLDLLELDRGDPFAGYLQRKGKLHRVA